MKLVFASSPSHDVLKRYLFLGTLCDPWELIEVRSHVRGSGSFGSHDWHEVIINRVGAMLDIAARHIGEVIVFSDVDVQWFRPAQAALLESLGNSDAIFQRELPGKEVVNCGFLAIRSNSAVMTYLKILCEAAKNGRHDQEVTNELTAQKKMPCSYGLLPATFHNDNHTGTDRPSPQDIIMYHSVGTFGTPEKTSVQIKLEKHLAMRARVLGHPSVFQSTPGAPYVTAQTKPLRYLLGGLSKNITAPPASDI